MPILKRILWAVDAFEGNDDLLKNAAMTLISLVNQTGAQIQPLHILNPMDNDLPLEASGLSEAERYVPAAEKALENTIEEFSIPNTLPAKVILRPFSTSGQAAEVLVHYARQENSDLIVANTHGRSGVKRFFLGSFAESLLLQSPIPVLVVGPGIHGVHLMAMKEILLPTDFGPTAHVVFRHSVELAKLFKVKLNLFHAIPHPIEPVFQSGVYLLGGSWIPVQSFFNVEVERHRKHAEAWKRWARDQGVETEIAVDTRGVSISDSILELAKSKNCGMVVMDAQSGRISAALIGSITRHVIRHASCPVWVIRSSLVEPKTHTQEKIGRVA